MSLFLEYLVLTESEPTIFPGDEASGDIMRSCDPRGIPSASWNLSGALGSNAFGL